MMLDKALRKMENNHSLDKKGITVKKIQQRTKRFI